MENSRFSAQWFADMDTRTSTLQSVEIDGSGEIVRFNFDNFSTGDGADAVRKIDRP